MASERTVEAPEFAEFPAILHRIADRLSDRFAGIFAPETVITMGCGDAWLTVERTP